MGAGHSIPGPLGSRVLILPHPWQAMLSPDSILPSLRLSVPSLTGDALRGTAAEQCLSLPCGALSPPWGFVANFCFLSGTEKTTRCASVFLN